MFHSWIFLSPLLLGSSAFMIHNLHHSLCLEDSARGPVLLKACSLESESQQWIWVDQGLLVSLASSRCLSPLQRDPVQTLWCPGPEVDGAGFLWDCDRDRLIGRNSSMLLSTDGRRLILTQGVQHSKWRSLDAGDVCQERLRSRRASDDPEEFEAAEKQPDKLAAMTEEQREYLYWFYRTEDPTTWMFVLLGLAFLCLLIGFLLLGMGAMANKNRKKVAKYKAAAGVAQRSGSEELQVISPFREDALDDPWEGHRASPSNGEVGKLRAGDIVVTWKDGNTSCLHPDPAAEGGDEGEEPATEPEADKAAEATD